jgi:putative transposase
MSAGRRTCVGSGVVEGWANLDFVMDCHSRALPGWHLARSGRSKIARSVGEHALIVRFSTLGRPPESLRPDNGLLLTRLVRSYGLRQEFITPHSPEQGRIAERLIRTLKDQYVRQRRFETLQHVSRVIGECFVFYNTRRPHYRRLP